MAFGGFVGMVSAILRTSSSKLGLPGGKVLSILANVQDRVIRYHLLSHSGSERAVERLSEDKSVRGLNIGDKISKASCTPM
ncbi:Hypothetical protein FKW44_020367, partial [Caligus rogercresseyi]